MADRLLLDKIDYENRCITIGDVTYPLEDTDFPTVDPKDPYTLTPEEESVIDQLTASFQRSEKLQKHVRFLYSKGSLYKVFNGNLLFHGCVPMTEDGQLLTFTLGGRARSGKEFFDFADTAARQAYYHKPGSPERQQGMDFLWFLWAGRNSPIFGRDRMTTFERRLIKEDVYKRQVFFSIVVKAVRMRESWPDVYLQGLRVRKTVRQPCLLYTSRCV